MIRSLPQRGNGHSRTETRSIRECGSSEESLTMGKCLIELFLKIDLISRSVRKANVSQTLSDVASSRDAYIFSSGRSCASSRGKTGGASVERHDWA